MESIITLEPVFKEKIWGGRKLETEFGYHIPDGPVGECWAISAHPNGDCVITSGEYAGHTLSWLWAEHRELFGGAEGDRFPLLVKIIDAKDDLSIQVHPDDAYARAHENEYGKTECWYILDCEPGAELIYGFKKEISNEEFRRRVEDNTFLDVVNKVKVHKGDLFFIESGTLHAIGKGILLAEIQQNSNVTYRVYDYGRLGADGKPRQLHTEKAIAVTHCVPPTRDAKPEGEMEKYDGYTKQLLTSCDLFTVWNIDVNGNYETVADENSFVSLVVAEGNGEITCGEDTMPAKKGDSFFIPANAGKFSLDGNLQVIETRV